MLKRAMLGACLAAGGVLAGSAGADFQLASEVVVSGLARPLYVTHAPGDTGRIFIVEQRVGETGSVRVFDLVENELLRNRFIEVNPVSTGGEQGLLGMAFHPDYDNNGFFYLNYTDASGATVVERYQVSASDPNIADPDSGHLVMRISQPAGNHNGGWIEFGPDGYLYIATGDGGGAGDPWNNSQTIEDNLLGKMLRIDVDSDDFPNDPNRNYAIPSDNPFVGEPGDDEIWAYGLRNPWRNSFDPVTGDLWIADVGQSAIEEINFQPGDSPGGENYGWRCYEGTQPFNTSGCPPQSELVFPVYEYPRGGSPFRCSITGGEIYRGCAIPEMDGRYFFADLCSAEALSFRFEDGEVVDLRNHTSELLSMSQVTSFGRDARGELYITAFGANAVYRIVAADGSNACPPDCIADWNGDGEVDINDFFAYLDDFEAGDPRADLNNDGEIDINDFFLFLDAFEAGC